MDLNHIFLFLAVISPLVVLARTWRPGTQHHGWRIAALVVLAITAIAWFLVPSAAGYIGGLAWIALLFLPAIGLRKMTELAAQARLQIGCKTRRNSSNPASQRRAARSGPIISASGISGGKL